MNPQEPETLLVLAPRGRDARLACSILADAGFLATPASSMAEACEAIVETSAGALLIDEELITGPSRDALVEALANQPAWSDFPLLVFGASVDGHKRKNSLAALGNVTIVERPLTVRALLHAVVAAVRGRRRQYEGRRAIDQRDQFLAMLGHELRNPLAAIGLAIVGLERTAPVESKRHIGVVQRQTEHLARLVDDLLDVSRVTSGKIELHKSLVDLRSVVERCLTIATERARINGLTMEASMPARPLLVDGDRIRLEQVFNNLLTNAVKYTPRGGRIDVIVDEEGGDAVARIKDSGVGIAPDMLPLIFDLFVQAPGALARSAGGLGIGLTVVQSLLERHGGSIEACSAGIDQGTELIARLPLVAAAAKAAVIAAPEPEQSVSRTIVVVEDSEEVRESLRDYLEMLGHSVSTAEDGNGGLACILETSPSFALVDIGLPGIDGYEVARRVRDAVGPAVTLVAITGYGQPSDKEAARKAGFDQHLTKPLNLDTLRDLLHAGPGR